MLFRINMVNCCTYWLNFQASSRNQTKLKSDVQELYYNSEKAVSTCFKVFMLCYLKYENLA